jgi:hypothetical protein
LASSRRPHRTRTAQHGVLCAVSAGEVGARRAAVSLRTALCTSIARTHCTRTRTHTALALTLHSHSLHSRCALPSLTLTPLRSHCTAHSLLCTPHTHYNPLTCYSHVVGQRLPALGGLGGARAPNMRLRAAGGRGGRAADGRSSSWSAAPTYWERSFGRPVRSHRYSDTVTMQLGLALVQWVTGASGWVWGAEGCGVCGGCGCGSPPARGARGLTLSLALTVITRAPARGARGRRGSPSWPGSPAEKAEPASQSGKSSQVKSGSARQVRPTGGAGAPHLR